MGATVRIGEMSRASRFRRSQGLGERPPFTVDIRNVKSGQVFEILVHPEAPASLDLAVSDIQVADRHLVLKGKWNASPHRANVAAFLCGHDERFWFAAAIPESAHANTVVAAKEALKPAIVRAAQVANHVKAKHVNRRKNAGFVRQGEWFFVPAPELVVPDLLVLHNEPLQRGRGKPHLAEFLFRRGGVTVHVCSRYPNGLTESAYRDLIRRDPNAQSLGWRTMARDPEAYVKGRISHRDHKTIHLPFWHRVVPNTEHESRAGPRAGFLGLTTILPAIFLPASLDRLCPPNVFGVPEFIRRVIRSVTKSKNAQGGFRRSSPSSPLRVTFTPFPLELSSECSVISRPNTTLACAR
jgi:hypothetical protein